ncbi:hypothetical protein RUND412_007219 [Rhizina undulata]
MEFPETDPLEWSVEQVYTSFVAFADESLAGLLRQHEIDGHALLTGLNLQLLRDDLGIREFGKRHKIMRKITDLRNRSKMYQAHILQQAAATPSSGTHVPVSQHLITYMRTPDYVSASNANKRRGRGQVVPASSNGNRSDALGSPVARSRNVVTQEPPAESPTPRLELLARNDHAPLIIVNPFARLPGSSVTPVAVRIEDADTGGVARVIAYDSSSGSDPQTSEQHNFEIEDRPPSSLVRRIQPVQLYGDGDIDMGMEDSGDEMKVNGPETRSDLPSLALRRSSIPGTHGDRYEGGDVPAATQRRKSKPVRKYLSSKAIAVDQIFFGDVEVGEEMPECEEETGEWCIGESLFLFVFLDKKLEKAEAL